MSICISRWLIAICLINQSPPSNSYAINSLMSRVTAHTAAHKSFACHWSKNKSASLSKLSMKSKRRIQTWDDSVLPRFCFSVFCVDSKTPALGHRVAACAGGELRLRHPLCFFVFWKGPVITHSPFQVSSGETVSIQPQTQQKGLWTE